MPYPQRVPTLLIAAAGGCLLALLAVGSVHEPATPAPIGASLERNNGAWVGHAEASAGVSDSHDTSTDITTRRPASAARSGVRPGAPHVSLPPDDPPVVVPGRGARPGRCVPAAARGALSLRVRHCVWQI